MLNQLVQIPNQLLSHLDGLVQTDSPWLDRSTIKSVDLYTIVCATGTELLTPNADTVGTQGMR